LELRHYDANLQKLKSTHRLNIQKQSKFQPIQLTVIPAATGQNYLDPKTFRCILIQTVLMHFALLFAFPTTVFTCDLSIKARFKKTAPLLRISLQKGQSQNVFFR
jgi:hypothetical protein